MRTAIWKSPVDGPRMVRRINIDGDDQADRLAHGGEHRAVYVYQLDSYRYWERELGRDDFTYGQFGENFTVDGLADDEVCVGDRYRIGGALFEVTQPRVTCYRLGIRMDEPAMPSLLVSHHRPGFYLRVLEEGAVQAGDAIVKVADGPERLTIADVDALLYLPGKSRDMLERALRVPGAQRGLEGQLPRAAGGAAGGRAGVGGLRTAARRRGPARERERGLVPAAGHARGRRRRLLPHGAGAPAAGRARAPAQLLALRRARRARLPDQRQARGRGQPVPARARQGGRRARGRRAARQLRPEGRHAAGRPDQRGRRGDPGAGDAARARPRAHGAARVVAARRAQRRRARVRERGRRAAARAARGAPRRRLQPPGRGAIAATTSPAASASPRSPPSRSTPTSTCAGRRRSCARSAPR